MNACLLSSKNMCWCTPKDFFDKLNAEFSFVLDAAATEKTQNALCFSRRKRMVLHKAGIAAELCFAILPTDVRSVSGLKKLTPKHKEDTRSSCLSRRERIRHIFTNTSTEKRTSALCAGGCGSRMTMENARFGQPFPSDKIVRLVGDDGEIQVYNCCTEFDAIDKDVAEAYKALFED